MGFSDPALILPGAVSNTEVSASAAIAYSKLNLALGIVNADVSASAAIAKSKLAFQSALISWTGNSSVNRAIPHGLSSTPIAGVGGNQNGLVYFKNANAIMCGTAAWTVTAMDATNVYVGNASGYDCSMNLNSTDYWLLVVT